MNYNEIEIARKKLVKEITLHLIFKPYIKDNFVCVHSTEGIITKKCYYRKHTNDAVTVVINTTIPRTKDQVLIDIKSTDAIIKQQLETSVAEEVKALEELVNLSNKSVKTDLMLNKLK